MVTLVPRALGQIFYACDHKQQFFQIGNNFYTQTTVAPLKSSQCESIQLFQKGSHIQK